MVYYFILCSQCFTVLYAYRRGARLQFVLGRPRVIGGFVIAVQDLCYTVIPRPSTPRWSCRSYARRVRTARISASRCVRMWCRTQASVHRCTHRPLGRWARSKLRQPLTFQKSTLKPIRRLSKVKKRESNPKPMNKIFEKVKPTRRKVIKVQSSP